MIAEETEKKPSSTRAAPRRHPGRGRRRVLLTGATGFVGAEVQRQLLARGWEVVALARHPRSDTIAPGVIQVAADITGDGWYRWCEGCSAAIHLVGIIREAPRQGITFDRLHRQATERVIEACRLAGIPRLVHMSALGARAQGLAPYQRSKAAGEQAVRASGLAWTIFRPSVIFGPGDGFSTTLARSLRRAPFFPIFGDGMYRLQPIAVEEVAEAFVAALELSQTEKEIFDLGGPEALSFTEVLRRTCAGLAIRRTFFRLPLGLARAVIRVLQHLPGAPITLDQLAMLVEGSTCDTAAASLVLGLPRRRYEGPTWLAGR
ncbi:MAG: complex I NDUFA9 subunit family protein [Acidobacteriota bacterium]